MTDRLPEGFEDMEVWVPDWVLPDSVARGQKRQHTEIADIRAFYDAALEAAPRALALLAQKPLGELDAREEALLKLMLALAEIGPAVEWYGQPQVVDGFDPEAFRLTLQIPDTEPQG